MDTCEKWDALHTAIHFGKYKGDILESILEQDPSYLQWLLDIGAQGTLLDSLLIIRDDIANAVLQEKYDYDYDECIDTLRGFPDPIYD